MKPFTWGGRPVPSLRSEAHFGDRVVRCFVERPCSLDEMFRQAMTRYGARDAVLHDSGRWSYLELAEAVDRAAAGMGSLGIQRGDRVALLIGNRPEFVVMLLAAQRLRAIAVPIGIREQAPGIAYILGQCGARLLIHDPNLSDRVPPAEAMPAGVRTLSLDEETQWRPGPGADAAVEGAGDGMRGRPRSEEGTEEDTAIILYTSGTTGKPKGAMLSHFNIIHSALHYEFCMQLTEGDRSAMAVPASHVTGLVGMIMAMLRVGGALVIIGNFKAATFLDTAASQRITHTILVPAMYQLCLLDPGFDRHDLSAWRIGAYGGAPMPLGTIETLARKLPRLTLMNAYGATETSSPATLMPSGEQAAHLASIGQPVPAADIKVMDDAGREVEPGATGELWIGGPMVVAGYWDNPEATAQSFVGGYWLSGDVGSIDEAGFVRIYDRKKDMLNRGGYKIYSVEVENVLLGCEGVLEAAVIGKSCPVLGERVHAVVSVSEALAADPDQCRFRLHDHCAARLADYKVPETWVVQREPLPRNANGKLMKRSLRAA